MLRAGFDSVILTRVITEKTTLLLFPVEFGKVKVAVLSRAIAEMVSASATAGGHM